MLYSFIIERNRFLSSPQKINKNHMDLTSIIDLLHYTTT